MNDINIIFNYYNIINILCFQLFGEMYKHGNLSKNDIKLFPFLLYRILEKKSELSADDDELLGQGSEPSVDN